MNQIQINSDQNNRPRKTSQGCTAAVVAVATAIAASVVTTAAVNEDALAGSVDVTESLEYAIQQT